MCILLTRSYLYIVHVVYLIIEKYMGWYFLFVQVINKTGFMSGLYTVTEMNPDNVKVDYRT